MHDFSLNPLPYCLLLLLLPRSMREFSLKMKRGTGHSQYSEANQRAGRTHKGWGYFDTINRSATATCVDGVWLYDRCCRSKQ